jgi:peptidoglycan/LPS O-acetylase OafA/YrhL
MRHLALAGCPRFVALALAMLAMVALALLVTRYPERWLRLLLDQFLKKGNPHARQRVRQTEKARANPDSI